MRFPNENDLPDTTVGTLTFYHQHLLKIRESCFYKVHIYEQIMLAKRFMDRQFSHDINLNDMAREAFFSKYHFIRLFKNIYGRTPNQYLTTIRIEEAKKLLRTPISITDVCITVGFNSLSSFTGLFRKVTGFTPSEYRAQQKSNFKETL